MWAKVYEKVGKSYVQIPFEKLKKGSLFKTTCTGKLSPLFRAASDVYFSKRGERQIKIVKVTYL